ncbi:hypothetical protein TrVE_jg6842 [Triparma verrucosa]|uniref:Citrate transporter-like domain-containing protein n=1 Tax=Triparma verrucosa TaxID=1606542 RepID=A0A9W7BKL3_9STRA|nr:hypothetical protein TrVE_jg6842 [Triparma verrucosa]
MSSSRPFVPSPPPSSHPKRSITLPLPRTVQPPLSPSSPPSSPHTLVPRLRVDSITQRALHPTHVEHHLLKKQRRDRERNESLNRHYNTVIAELPEEDRDVFFGGDVEETGLTDTDDTKSKFPPAPKLILTLRDKINLIIILLASILSLVIIVAWIGPNMNDAHDRLLINVHKVGLNENPGFVLGISGLGGTDIVTAQQPVLRKISSSATSSNVFDIRVVLGASESSQPVTSRRKNRRNLSRVLSSNDVKINSGTVDITVIYKAVGEQDNICTTPIKKTIYSNAETEMLETLNADEIGSPCPSLSTPSVGVYYFSLTTSSSSNVGCVFEVLQLPGWAKQRVLISGLLLIIVYVFIVLDVIHRTLVAMVGGLISLLILAAMGEYRSLQDAVIFIDESTLALLFGMMIIVNIIATTGVFEWIAIRALERSKGDMRKLLVMLCIATAILSAFLDNVTTMLLLAPVTIEMCMLIEIDPIPFLISEVMFSNVGGTSTMIGDPPNIIIGSLLGSYVSFTDFIINLMPPIIVICFPVGFFLVWWYKADLQPGVKKNFDIEMLKKQYPVTKPLLLLQSSIIMSFVMLLFFLEPIHHISTSWISILGAISLMLIATPHELHTVFESVEWDTLLFFASLFVMIEAMAEMGLIRWIGSILSSIISAAPPSNRLTVAIVVIIWASALVSGFLDNIPYTTTMVPVIKQLADDPDLGLPLNPLIWSLSLGACLGGNMTLVGASANLVTAGTAEHVGHKIGFVQFMKVGSVVVGISVTLAMTWCLLVYDVGGWQGDT